MTPFVQCMSVTVSIFSLVLIALERHQLILHPTGWSPAAGHSYLAVGLTWLVACFISLPFLSFNILTNNPFQNISLPANPFRWAQISNEQGCAGVYFSFSTLLQNKILSTELNKKNLGLCMLVIISSPSSRAALSHQHTICDENGPYCELNFWSGKKSTERRKKEMKNKLMRPIRWMNSKNCYVLIVSWLRTIFAFEFVEELVQLRLCLCWFRAISVESYWHEIDFNQLSPPFNAN